MTPQADRIASLDVLRGLGVLGILAVNAPFFAQPLAAMMEPAILGPLDAQSAQVWSIVHIFFERKFVTLFSMLFGASILLVGGDRGDREKAPILYRRLGWLLLFGIAHGAFIWYGDILLCYAVAGFIAAQFRGWTPRRLFIVGIILCLVMAALEVAQAWAMAYAPEGGGGVPEFATPEGARQEIAGYSGTLETAQATNLGNWAVLALITAFYIPGTVGLMFIGMGLLKTGVFSAKRGVAFYLLLFAVGAACFAAMWWAVGREVASGFEDEAAAAVRMSINATLAPLMTLGYVGLFCLIVKSPLRGLTRPLAATGQMAFTNYLTQSLIMTGIYYAGRGLGLFGTHTLAEQVPIVAGIWLLQLIWSPLWMMAFRYGPFEWVWRSLTFWRFVPMRR
jgi:uncharacterized protein